MSKSRVFVCLFAAAFLSSPSYAATPDRIAGDLGSGQSIPLYSGATPLRLGQDLGRADGGRVMRGVSLTFQLSPSQQKDMDQFLAELADHSSPNFHRYLTPAQYAARFGMSQNDLNKVVAWVRAQGFTNIRVAKNQNKISFDGTVSLIESAFGLEMHNYLVDGVIHLANASNPSLPAALASVVLHVGHLNDFAPKPRLQVRSHFTSYVSGDHFLTPGDFATIYDLNPLYSAGATGSTQTIAIVGQSTVSTTDLNNFRSAAGLPASTVTMTVVGGTATRCPGDEGESDLDLEWSGGVAKNAQIVFLYAGLETGDTCTNRTYSVWDAMEEALTGSLSGTGTPVAPFVSTSYGYCEPGLQQQDQGFVATVRSWVQQGQTEGVTLVSASGDSGAADCDDTSETSATLGYAVDAPASIPETTGAGGNEFLGDAAGTVTGTAPSTAAGATPYWGASNTGSDAISTALSYIPEEGWNDTTENIQSGEPGAGLAASGGGASVLFSKPTWQTQTGNSVLASATMRLVPDISLAASANHDGYLFCSEDTGTTTTTATCTDGFRTGAGGDLTVVGGTSAVAPTFSAILALLNQYFGAASGVGLAPVNPELYQFAGTNYSTVFHDVTTGSNVVPCTQGSTNCPATSPYQYGFNAGTGYDEVTGLGSVDAYQLAQLWGATIPNFSVSATAFNPSSISAGASAQTTITVAPNNGFNQTVNFACSGLPTGATCSFNPTTVTTVANGSGTTQLTLQTLPTTPASTASVTVNGTSSTRLGQATASLAVTATAESFTLSANVTSGGTVSVAQGQTSGAINMTVTSTSTPSFVVSSGTSTQTAVPVTYTCSGLPTESTCLFNGTANTLTTQLTAVALTIQTTAPTSKMERPLDRGTGVFYALLMPAMLGIFFITGPHQRARGGLKILALIMMLGFATLWTASCGGGSSSNSNKNPGTPVGSSSVVVNATTSSSALSATLPFTLSVTAAP
jgi:subtilase family serine protease